MGIPILTSEGFAGRRWIIDDYFRAGERLYCGDVVGIQQDTQQSNLPRVFRVILNVEPYRVIGVVHTPAAKDVGDEAAQAGDFVAGVAQGVAQALSAGPVGVGDPVVPSGSAGNPLGKASSLARVEAAAAHSHRLYGESGHTHGGDGGHEHTIGQASRPVNWSEPRFRRTVSVARSSDNNDEYLYAGESWDDDKSHRLVTADHPGHGHGGGSRHTHAMGSAERGAVVGKALTPCSRANQVIEVLVDIAG